MAVLPDNSAMLKNCRATAVALLCWCGLLSGIGHASETRVLSGSPYVVDVWGTADRLPDDTVISLIQAHDGYLWVGTLHGLARFDGCISLRLMRPTWPAAGLCICLKAAAAIYGWHG